MPQRVQPLTSRSCFQTPCPVTAGSVSEGQLVNTLFLDRSCRNVVDWSSLVDQPSALEDSLMGVSSTHENGLAILVGLEAVLVIEGRPDEVTAQVDFTCIEQAVGQGSVTATPH